MHYRPPSTFNNFFKALIKYINMQQDWALRSLIIYRKLGRIMEYLISVSVGLLWNAIKEDLKSASPVRFKKAFKRICHLQILIGVLYMQLTVCKAVVLSCFFVYSFVYLFIYYSLNIFSLCVFVCICLFITTLISSYFPAWPSHSARLAFAISEWLCSLSFTIIYFLWLYTFVLRAQ